jgi:hypothetical protein
LTQSPCAPALPNLQSVKEILAAERRRIVHEIFHYAPPITRCDVQYNTLLEERAAINREVARLERMTQAEQPSQDDVQALGEYIASAAFLDNDTKQRIHGWLVGALA